MSDAGAIASPPGLEQSAGVQRTERPLWLRPAAVVAALALHAAVAAFFVGRAEPMSPIDAIEVTLVAQGDSDDDRKEIDEIKEAEALPPPSPAPQVTEPAPELVAPPRRIVAPVDVPVPAAKPKPVVRPKKRVVVDEQKNDRLTPTKLREQRRQRAEAAERRKAQAGQQAARRGVLQGQAGASGISRASYASLLSAELNRRKVYPSSARTAGVTGSVGVAFTVGPSGRVIRHLITSSSGSAAQDGAVHAMMAAVHTPSPPGGNFSTSTTVRFSFH